MIKLLSVWVYRGETHKNDVLMFCQKMARESRIDVDMIDRESADLLWKLMELLIKQNGASLGLMFSDLISKKN